MVPIITMNSTFCYKNLRWLPLAAVGVFLASAFLFWSVALAAEEGQIQDAIKDLSATTGQDISSEEQARTFCNQEQYLDVCADIGKKHALYEAEELKHVNDFLSEVKGTILADIKSCADEECLIRVAGELAQKIKTKNPALAADFKLTATVVAEKQGVVQAAKEAGVNFKDCEAMDPDSAPIDLLRKCARLAKDTRVQKYIPEERRSSADQFGDTTIKLREGLTSGKYQCGDGTLEGCGNFCLKPSATSQATGIPEVCRQIAKEIFGADGVKELEQAHQQVGQVQDYYSKKFILTLPDGKELVGERQIRTACDEAFSGQLNNLDMARACGNFAVNNGFATRAEVDKGLKLLESFNQSGQGTDFNQCLRNPVACREFIPEDERNSFDAGNQIFEIMKTEIGFDPMQCERGAADEAIGLKCFEGSKRALAKIEALGLQSREARFIIDEIRGHVSEGENMMNRKDEFQQVFSQQGGPGGCKSERECFAYCSNPTNGPECISFGAKQNISGFRGQEAVDKFQQYNQNIQRPGLVSEEYHGEFSFPGQGPYPGFQPPGQGGFPPGQIPGFNQPGPGFGGPAGPSPECFAAIQSGDFVRAKTVCATSVPTGPDRQYPVCPAMPYVECPAGQYRESSRNNDGCWVDGPCRPAPSYSAGPYPTYTYYPIPPVGTFCGGITGVQCPAGYFCQLDGTYPDAGGKCVSSSFPEKSSPSCPMGQWWDYTYDKCTSAPACGSGYYWDEASKSCKPTSPTDTVPPGSKPQCSDGLDNDKDGKTDYPADSSCYGPDDWDEYYPQPGESPHPTYSSYPTPTTSKCPSEFAYDMGGYCKLNGDTTNTKCASYSVAGNKDNYSSDCSKLACPSGQWWDYAKSACVSSSVTSPYPTVSYTPGPGTGSCPSGYHYHGESGGYCINDQENVGGICYNSAGTSKITCPAVQPTSTPPPSCPSGQWWDYAKNMCVSSTTSYTPYPSCPAGQWWDMAMSKCTSTTTSSTPPPSCPSGQWWDYAKNMCVSSTSTSTPPPSCPAGSWWDYALNKCATGSCSIGYYWDSATSTCKISSTSPAPTATTTTTYTPYPTTTTTTTYTPAPTATTCGTGYYWDSAASMCKSTCSSTQYWNGSACVDNVTTTYTPMPTTMTTTYTPMPTMETHTCPTGQVWNGSACVTASGPYDQQKIAHCQQLGRTWNGKICEANGLLARIYEGSGMANLLRIFYLVP
ncbi:MAG: hypothetical protein G01um101444_214 [Parcubacteria group bacterium Gr01-1014_44]|nr:MAG: hypothetical protein G01um101444_214 [Parcubacteria group bacterium Gr01-1014_44]